MISAPLSMSLLLWHAAKMEMFGSHLETRGWEAKDNLEVFTQLRVSSTDMLVGMTCRNELFKGQNIERIEQRRMSNCPNTLHGRTKQIEFEEGLEEGAVKEKLRFVGC